MQFKICSNLTTMGWGSGSVQTSRERAYAFHKAQEKRSYTVYNKCAPREQNKLTLGRSRIRVEVLDVKGVHKVRALKEDLKQLNERSLQLADPLITFDYSDCCRRLVIVELQRSDPE